MCGSGKKGKKHDKQKKYEKDEKKKKKKKHDHEEKSSSKNHESKKSSIPDFIPYAEFLKNGKEGLYVVKVTVEDTKLETYILKDDNFEFPRVALNKSHDSYKDWLRKKIENLGSEISINKALYSSQVKPMDVPKGFLSKVINLSKSEDDE